MNEFVESVLQDRVYFEYENSWEDVARRVSRYVASAGVNKGITNIDKLRDNELTYFNLINERIFLPNSPTLFNAGKHTPKALFEKDWKDMAYKDYAAIANTSNKTCLSACFVGGISDSMQGIMSTLNDFVYITQAGGGFGTDFSPLRPKGAYVKGVQGTSSGVISFMEMFDTAGKTILQGGKRRAALMGVLDYNHPDIIDFIYAKTDNNGEGKLSFFNLSVDIDSETFYKLYQNDEYVVLRHIQTGEVGQIKARELLRLIAEQAWKTGDPGLVFTNKHNKYSPISNTERINSTNPCGEQFLPGSQKNGTIGSCNLGSIDILKVWKHQYKYDLESVVRASVQFLDDVVDINTFPLETIARTNKHYRNIGLGVMGVHDYLIERNIPYDSEEGAIEIARMMAIIAHHSYQASYDLGQEFGVAPAWETSKFKQVDGFVPFQMLEGPEFNEINHGLRLLFNKIKEKGLRNIALNTIAPTGTLSIIAETSSGIEPNFAYHYIRYMINKDGKRVPLEYVHPKLQLLAHSIDFEIFKDSGDLAEFGFDTAVYSKANEISTAGHIRMQNYAQAYVDNSISKTINLPNSASIEDIENVYLEALRNNCKGITVFRDGCLSKQVLETKKEERVESLPGMTKIHKSGDKKTYVTLNFKDNKPFEVFITGDGRTPAFIGRMISLSLKSGVEFQQIMKQLKKTGGFYKDLCAILEKIVEEFGEEPDVVSTSGLEYNSKGFFVDDEGNTVCPSCQSKNTIILQEGCLHCSACGYGKCS